MEAQGNGESNMNNVQAALNEVADDSKKKWIAFGLLQLQIFLIVFLLMSMTACGPATDPFYTLNSMRALTGNVGADGEPIETITLCKGMRDFIVVLDDKTVVYHSYANNTTEVLAPGVYVIKGCTITVTAEATVMIEEPSYISIR
jgi:hypothetical protein